MTIFFGKYVHTSLFLYNKNDCDIPGYIQNDSSGFVFQVDFRKELIKNSASKINLDQLDI